MLVPDDAVDVLIPVEAPTAAEAEAVVAPTPPAELAAGRPAAGRGEFLAGDSIRGVGMICVIGAHLAGGALEINHVYGQGFRAGYGRVGGVLCAGLQLGLPMFLVLSGYLISRPYIRAYVNGTRTPSLRRYLRHRVLRIVPVFWLLSAVMLAVYGTQGSSRLDLAALFGFAQIYHGSGASNFIGQAWTIDVEVAFYLMVPVSAWLIALATRRLAGRRGRGDLSPRGRVALIVGLLAVATVVSAWLRATTLGTLWTESPPATFYYFAPGIALAALELEFAPLLAGGRLPHLARAFGLGAAAITLALAAATSTDTNALLRTRGALGVALATGLATGALLARQLSRGDSPRWVDNTVTRWLGVRSYPAYIVQSATVFEAFRIVGRAGGPWTELLLLTVVGLPLTVAAGAVVHAAVERPVLAWGRGRTQRAVVAPQA
jgi:peptidoglycan/LPS O-acetylase OafA/YrhL